MSETTIQGTITDSDNNPIQGAIVKAINHESHDVYTGTTDENGEYSISTDENGEFHIAARADVDGSTFRGESVPFVQFFIPRIEIIESNIPSAVEQNEEFDVDVTVENTGAFDEDIPVELIAEKDTESEELLDSELVSLESEESEFIEFQSTADFDLGEIEIGIYTNIDSVVRTVEINDGVAIGYPILRSLDEETQLDVQK